MVNLIPQPWTFYGGLWHQKPEVAPTPDEFPSYLDRTKTVKASAGGGGIGTDADPWTLLEAMENAVSGDIVGIEAGVYVGVDPSAGAGSRYTPAFRPTNSGSAGNPIVFVAQNHAAINTSGFSDIRSGATVPGSGWPAFGSLSKSYVHFVGLYSDENNPNNKGCPDSGPATFWTGTGVYVDRCKIIGINAPFNDNHSGIRLENFYSGRVASNYIEGFNTQLNGGSTNQAGVMTYEMRNTVIEHNFIDNCGDPLYIKGREQYGNTIRFNWLEDATAVGMRLLSLEVDPISATNRNSVYQNVMYNCLNDIELGYHEIRPDAINGTDIFNNTSYISGAGSSTLSLYITDTVQAHDNTFNNNIVYGSGRKAYFSQESAGNSASGFAGYIMPNNNCYFGATYFADGTSGSDWNQIDFTTWKALTGADAGSQISNPLFISAGAGNVKLGGSSPCLNAGVDYKNLLGGGTSAPINQGAYISAGQTEVIGII